MTISFYVTIGRSTWRITRTDTAIFITTNRKHGANKDVPIDSDLGRKILAAATR